MMPTTAEFQQSLVDWLRRSGVEGEFSAPAEHFALGSHSGRRAENQDRTLFLRFPNPHYPTQSIELGVLCDGMGGMEDGARCAELAISVFAAHVLTCPFASPGRALQEAAMAANFAVYNLYKGRGGSTLSAVMILRDHVAALNVGDSRIYVATTDGQTKQVSIDDTVSGQLRLMGNPVDPRQPMHNQLLQFIGVGNDLVPHYQQIQVDDTVRLLILTSDGAHRPPAPRFEDLVKHALTPKELVQRLAHVSLWLGGEDNITSFVREIGKKTAGASSEKRNPKLVEIWGPSGMVEMWIDPTTSNKQAPVDRPEKIHSKSEKGRPGKRNKNRHESEAPRTSQRDMAEKQRLLLTEPAVAVKGGQHTSPQPSNTKNPSTESDVKISVKNDPASDDDEMLRFILERENRESESIRLPERDMKKPHGR